MFDRYELTTEEEIAIHTLIHARLKKDPGADVEAMYEGVAAALGW